MKLCFRILKRILGYIQRYYEVGAAPFIARYLHWMLWPFYLYLKKKKIVFVVNIACGAGHTFFELDNYSRMAFLKDIDDTKRYVWINKSDYFARVCSKLYGHLFFWTASKTWIYNLALPITMRYKDLILDCGCSRVKWQLPLNLGFPVYKRTDQGTYLYQIPKNMGLEQVNLYYKRLQNSVGFYPLIPRTPLPDSLAQFLGADSRKIALIHAKDTVINATASPTDPKTYLAALDHLRELNYRLIFVGREKMPSIFKDYGLLDYATSPITSYENDIHLFNKADLTIMSGSGIAVLPDCLNKFFLYLNSWHLAIPAFSAKSIHVPTVIKDKTGRLLTFKEQNALYRSMEDQGAERFPKSLYEPKNASAEEILEALKELLSLKEENKALSPLQMKFRALDSTAPLFYANSRCSDYFLNRYKELV